MEVQFSKAFITWLARQNSADTDKIDNFIEHVEANGFEGLPGRNKNSNEANTNKRDFLEKAQYANKHKLWHYHIGIPFYIKQNRYKKYEKGDYVSEFVLHYQIIDSDTIKLIKMDNHNPFAMPAEAELKERFNKLVASNIFLQEAISLEKEVIALKAYFLPEFKNLIGNLDLPNKINSNLSASNYPDILKIRQFNKLITEKMSDFVTSFTVSFKTKDTSSDASYFNDDNRIELYVPLDYFNDKNMDSALRYKIVKFYYEAALHELTHARQFKKYEKSGTNYKSSKDNYKNYLANSVEIEAFATHTAHFLLDEYKDKKTLLKDLNEVIKGSSTSSNKLIKFFQDVKFEFKGSISKQTYLNQIRSSMREYYEAFAKSKDKREVEIWKRFLKKLYQHIIDDE